MEELTVVEIRDKALELIDVLTAHEIDEDVALGLAEEILAAVEGAIEEAEEEDDEEDEESDDEDDEEGDE